MTRNHPFEGPEVFDDTPFAETDASLAALDPWPTVSLTVRTLLERRRAEERMGE